MTPVQLVVPFQTGKESAKSEVLIKWRQDSPNSEFLYILASSEICIHNALFYFYSAIFVSDKGCNLFELDLRNGGILCGYKGILQFKQL
jgi:hypothetical protein